jgi:hypothetical protein
MEQDVQRDLASGSLEQVLEDWCPRFDGVFLYHPQASVTAAMAGPYRFFESSQLIEPYRSDALALRS